MPFELPPEIAATVPAEYVSHPTMQRYNNLGDVFKSHIDLSSYQGRSIALPNGESRPEDVTKWVGDTSEKLKGHGFTIAKLSDQPPLTADAYEFKFDGVAPEVVKSDAVVGKFRAIAHQFGLNNQQAQGLVEAFGKDILPALIPPKEKEPDYITGDAAKQLVENVFKGETTQRVAEYKQAISILKQTIPELPDLLNDGVIEIEPGRVIAFGDYPPMIKLLSEIGRMTQPDFGGNVMGNTPAALDAQKEIDDIRNNEANPRNKLWKAGDRGTLAHLDSLYAQLTGGR